MAGQKELRDKIKSLWIRGMKAVGNAAASIANNTRYKVDEVTIQNRRREVLNDIAHKAYALWLKGETFPEMMGKMLEELKQLDEQLNDIRAEKYASSTHPRTTDTYETEEPEETAENGYEEDSDEYDAPLVLPVEDSHAGSEINELFDDTPSVDKSAEKVNSSLNQLSDRIHTFSRTGSDEKKEGQGET